MRTIQHHIDPFGSHELVLTCDERDPDAAGASHEYEVHRCGGKQIGGARIAQISFQHGPRGADGYLSGCNHAVILAVLIDRYEALQAGSFACDSNDRCLAGLRTVLDIERSRAAERKARGVLGVNKA